QREYEPVDDLVGDRGPGPRRRGGRWPRRRGAAGRGGGAPPPARDGGARPRAAPAVVPGAAGPHAVAAGAPVADEIVDRLVLPLVEQAAPEWRAALDALLAVPGIGGPVGYSGGVFALGIRLALVEPRIAAAVLFAGSYVPRAMLDEARRVRIPLLVLLQWDDEGNDRRQALEVFDALGSREKTLHANMGGHTGVPWFEGDDANRFFARHLKSADSTDV
ncbi:alpha/beta hydrolase, partial [Nocardia farcinica]|uniref:alpha/beta hydrolase n=1 Tax=Nocardia farcinica TaxID=37329 RepID=UPI0024555F16